MLHFLRGLRPLDRFVALPAFLLAPVLVAVILHRSVADEFGEGAYRVTLVAMLCAFIWAVLFTNRYVRAYPATFSLGGLILCVANVIFGVVGWHRTYLIVCAVLSATVITAMYQWHLEKAQKAAAAELVDAPVEAPLPFDDTAYQRNLIDWERELLDDYAERAGGNDRFKPKGPMVA